MPSNDPQNDFERAAQQARDKVAAERKRKEDEARKKAEAAAEKARLEEEQAQARRRQFADAAARFDREFVNPLLRSFARAQNVPTEGPAADPPAPEGAAPCHRCSVMLLPEGQPKLTVTVSCQLVEGSALTGLFRGKESVAVQVQAVREGAGWKRVLGVGQLYDKSSHFVLGDFAGNQRLTVETWLRQRMTELSAKCAEALARQGP